MPSPSFSFLIYKYRLTSSRRATEYKCNFVRSTNYSKILLKYISHGVYINEITSIWNFFYLVLLLLKGYCCMVKIKRRWEWWLFCFPKGTFSIQYFLRTLFYGLLVSLWNPSIVISLLLKLSEADTFTGFYSANCLLLPCSSPTSLSPPLLTMQNFRQYLILAKKL